jgi:hypothetical protein
MCSLFGTPAAGLPVGENPAKERSLLSLSLNTSQNPANCMQATQPGKSSRQLTILETVPIPVSTDSALAPALSLAPHPSSPAVGDELQYPRLALLTGPAEMPPWPGDYRYRVCFQTLGQVIFMTLLLATCHIITG